MESLKRTVKFLNIDSKSSVLIFWMVMILINIISYVLNIKGIFNINGNNISFGIHMGEEDNFGLTSVSGANIMPIIIFYIIYTYMIYYENLPIAIGFSSSRKNFFLSIIFNNTLVAIIFSLIQTILLKIDIKLIESLGKNPYVNFTNFNTLTDNVIFIFLSMFLLSICFLGFTNLLASANYKFGYKMWILLIIALGIMLNLQNYKIFDYIYNLFTQRVDLSQLLSLIVTSLIT